MAVARAECWDAKWVASLAGWSVDMSAAKWAGWLVELLAVGLVALLVGYLVGKLAGLLAASLAAA